jgi:hypothetical protein
MRKLANPPAAIKTVLEAVCVVLEVKPVKARRPRPLLGSLARFTRLTAARTHPLPLQICRLITPPYTTPTHPPRPRTRAARRCATTGSPAWRCSTTGGGQATSTHTGPAGRLRPCAARRAFMATAADRAQPYSSTARPPPKREFLPKLKAYDKDNIPPK